MLSDEIEKLTQSIRNLSENELCSVTIRTLKMIDDKANKIETQEALIKEMINFLEKLKLGFISFKNNEKLYELFIYNYEFCVMKIFFLIVINDFLLICVMIFYQLHRLPIKKLFILFI